MYSIYHPSNIFIILRGNAIRYESVEVVVTQRGGQKRSSGKKRDAHCDLFLSSWLKTYQIKFVGRSVS
jgi:hypothetical protein